jgi:ribosomal protein S12 methylthiotransferase
VANGSSKAPRKRGGKKAVAKRPRRKPGKRGRGRGPSEDSSPEKPVVFMASLGCAKNQVDSEQLAAALAGEGFLLTAHPSDADLALVNTCSFLEAAREETRDLLAELQEYKQRGRLRAVIAAGCYPAHSARVPGADLVLRFRDYPRLAAVCRKALGMSRSRRRAPAPGVLSRAPRLRFGLKTTAYLKLAEGCSNRCAYCTIPKIRGRLRSRPLEDLVNETYQLVADGAREIVLVAQDTTAYGRDLRGGEPMLAELIRRLLDVRGYRWLRLMYAHPAHITDEVIELFLEERLVDYLDMPIQHVDDRVLKSMGRGYGIDDLRRLIARLRRGSPRMALRTTCMVGFPGETAAAFNKLRTFLVEARFDHLGAFVYSPEPGTRAARRKRQVSARVKTRRWHELMAVQKLLAGGRCLERVGDRVTVMVESPGRNGPARGRCQYQAPDVDGGVIVTRPHAAMTALQSGDFAEAVITAAHDYDLVASLV